MKIKEHYHSQIQAGQLWDDLQEYFRELFTAKKNVATMVMPAEHLKTDLEARFGNQYNSDELVDLLRNGYEKQTTAKGPMFCFNRTDFFPDIKVREIEEKFLPVEVAAGPVEAVEPAEEEVPNA